MRPIVPYIEPPSFEVFGATVHLFGVLVLLAVVVGVVLATRRVRATGLDPTLAENLIIAAVVPGFFVAHAFDLIAYHPERVRENPLELLRFWGAMSSFGGIFGGLAGMLVFFAWHAERVDVATRLRYLDAIAYGFSFAWILGRLGCTFALDHPGRITDFVLATSLESAPSRFRIHAIYVAAGRGSELVGDAVLMTRGFHNLGFYEMLYTAFVVVPVVALHARRMPPPGHTLGVFFLAYSPIRFALDFLRVGDATYGGLTPGQYAAIVATLASVWLLRTSLARSARRVL